MTRPRTTPMIAVIAALASFALAPLSLRAQAPAPSTRRADPTRAMAADLSSPDAARRAAAAAQLKAILDRATATAEQLSAARARAAEAANGGDPAATDAARKELADLNRQARAAAAEVNKVYAATESAMRAAEREHVAGPTLVSLDLTDTPADEAFADLARQTGYDIRPYSQGDWPQGEMANVNVVLDDQPFWVAFREVCRQAGVSLYNSGEETNALRVMPLSRGGQNFFKYPASVQGSFAVFAQSIQRSNSADLGTPDKINRSTSMQIMVLVEPKVKLGRYGYQPVIEEAVDDKGNSLVMPVQGGNSYQSTRGSILTLGIPLTYPENPGTRIARLRGKVRAQVITRTDAGEIKDVMTAKDATMTVGGVEMTLRGVKKQGERNFQVEVTIVRGQMERQRFSELMNNPRLKLVDAKGRAYRFQGASGGSSDENGARYTFSFYRTGANEGDAVPPGEPATLSWEAATNTQEIGIPFEFTDLPLP